MHPDPTQTIHRGRRTSWSVAPGGLGRAVNHGATPRLIASVWVNPEAADEGTSSRTTEPRRRRRCGPAVREAVSARHHVANAFFRTA
jgi:hypothetical protein